MGYKKIILSSILLVCIGITAVIAQESITSSGGDASGIGGTVNYTIGQALYSSNSGTNGSVSEGIQQPYEISVVSSIEGAENIKLMISVYPNPTQDILTLSVRDIDLNNFLYQLYDVSGSLIEVKAIKDSETKIKLSEYNSSIYFLKLICNNKEIKTFKIIKN